jgi:NADPH-dependent glutamate synthase beta subunit-like oxidoreductase
MTKERFWVIGGEYSGMDFAALKDGAQKVLGPFETRDEASQVWKRVSQETRALATARFAIASEQLVLPA